jgi:hypothetical protein
MPGGGDAQERPGLDPASTFAVIGLIREFIKIKLLLIENPHLSCVLRPISK